jgi:hypothetical protein
VGGSGMPSKTWSIMACGTPIIAAFDTDSELAETIAKANAGVSVEPENAGALSSAILSMVDGDARQYGGGRDYAVSGRCHGIGGNARRPRQNGQNQYQKSQQESSDMFQLHLTSKQHIFIGRFLFPFGCADGKKPVD